MPKTKIPGSDRKPQLATANDSRMNVNPYAAATVERRVFRMLCTEEFYGDGTMAERLGETVTDVRKALKTISLDKRTPNVLQIDMTFRFQRGTDYIPSYVDPTRIDV